MSERRKTRLAVVGGLFALAAVFYLIGFTTGAVVASVAAVFIEAFGWIALFSGRDDKALSRDKK